jgi:hypothetical protein
MLVVRGGRAGGCSSVADINSLLLRRLMLSNLDSARWYAFETPNKVYL